jgi:hypothetical protein
LTLLPLSEWDILIAEKLLCEDFCAIQCGSCPILKVRIMTLGSFPSFDSVFPSSISLTRLCLKVKRNIDYLQCLANWLIYHVFPKKLTTIKKQHKFSKWNWFRLYSFWHDISPVIWVTPSTPFTVLYRENLWIFVFLAVKCILVTKIDLFEDFLEGFLLIFSPKLFKNYYFSLILVQISFFWCIK